MQFLDECVERGAWALSNYFHATAAWQVADMAAKAKTATDAGDEEAEANALYAAADSCVEPLGASGLGFHVRGARLARARCAEVRG